MYGFIFLTVYLQISEEDSAEAELLNRLREFLPSRENSNPPAMVFHGVDGENYQTPDSPSWFNPQEASQVFFYLNELYRMGIASTDIGIISPYIKQVRFFDIHILYLFWM